jgi:hypothetical protein
MIKFEDAQINLKKLNNRYKINFKFLFLWTLWINANTAKI